MKARRYEVFIEGGTPLLMHQDSLTWNEKVATWLKDPENNRASIAGDDRYPAWRWMGYLYREGGQIIIPSDNLMTVLREGGAKCPTGKKGGTYKKQTQSGLVVDQSAWPLLINGKPVNDKFVNDLLLEPDFSVHEELALSLGFELFIKRAKIGRAKHVRVRPRFDKWSCGGTITVLDEMITTETLERILEHAGFYSGLCDWRPSSPMSPGPFGKFSAKVKQIS